MEVVYQENLFIKIIELLNELGSEAIKEDSQKAFKDLQNQALNFVNTIEEEIGKEKSIFEDMIKQVKKGTHYTTTYKRMYAMMKKDEELSRKIINAQEKFQIAINKFQNIVMGLIYMNTDTGEILAFSEIQMGQLYKNFITK